MELYEITRGIWRIGAQREKARYAFAVYQGVVREVFRIESWHPAGSTPYQTRGDMSGGSRWEFVGDVAEEKVRAKYLLKSVKSYFGENWQTPFVYVNC